MNLWAIADTHLSFGRPKPMDIFGELWRDHPARLKTAWDQSVGADDVVLIAGDISWAQTLAEAAPDLEFLAARPGRLKLLLRGNHDTWWPSAGKLKASLPSGFDFIQHDARRLDPEPIVICGARGWNLPSMRWFDPEKDPAIFRRELERLSLSLEAASALRRAGDLLIAMLHYPPLGPGDSGSPVMELLIESGVDLAVFGHLHGTDHEWAPERDERGVRLRFVAADHTLFAPRPIYRSGHGLL